MKEKEKEERKMKRREDEKATEKNKMDKLFCESVKRFGYSGHYPKKSKWEKREESEGEYMSDGEFI